MSKSTERTVTGILTNIERMPSSSNGNPRYKADIAGETIQTETDASLGYAITNYRDKAVTATVRQYYGKPTFVRIKELTK